MKLIISSLLLTLCLLTCTTNSAEVNTGNILTNSTFGNGTTYSTEGWTVSQGTHGHNYMAAGGGNDIGGSVAAEEDTVISQTITLSEDADMNHREIQNGWTSELNAEIWFWNQYNNTTKLKQEITGSDGNTFTQQRVIEHTGCGSINCGGFTEYTDQHVQGANTQTDFDIKVSVENTNNRTGHWGPDIDDVELSVTYTDLLPIEDDAQDAIEDIDEDLEDIFDDIPEDIYFEEEFVFEEYFTIDELPVITEEELPFESFEEFEEMFDLEVMDEVPMETIEEEEIEMAELEADMEMEMEMEEPDMEEPEMASDPEPEAEPEMEIEEEATIEDTQEPETEEVQNEDTVDESSETMEEEPENEDSISEATEDEDETMEEGEPDSEESEDSEIQTAEGRDENEIQTESKKQIEVSGNIGGTTEIKFEKIEKELSKLDRLLIQPELDTYEKVEFYESKEIYQDGSLELFENQLDLGSYNVQIYANISLSSYSLNDPIEIFNEKLEFLARQKLAIMIELKRLKN